MNEKNLFHRAHYNAIAKDIRIEFGLAATGFESYAPNDKAAVVYHAKASAFCDLAITFAKRFQEDNSEFDPVTFLNQCSPDEDKYPLGELWDA